MSDPLMSSRDPRGEQDPHARVLVPGAGSEIEGRANRLFGELRQRRMLLAQLVVIGQLIGQAGDVRQQVTDRHVVPPVAREGGQELLHAVIELKLPLIEQSHDGRHVDRLGDGAEQEHRVARGRLAEVARERLVSLNHVQHGRVHLLRRRGPLEHFGRVIPPPPAQGGEQGGCVRHGQGRPKKRASPHGVVSSRPHCTPMPRRSVSHDVRIVDHAGEHGASGDASGDGAARSRETRGSPARHPGGRPHSSSSMTRSAGPVRARSIRGISTAPRPRAVIGSPWTAGPSFRCSDPIRGNISPSTAAGSAPPVWAQ